VSIVGRTIVVTGVVRAVADMTIDARIDGSVWCDGALTVASSASVTGEIVARDITVFGRVSGQLVATDAIDIRAGAVVASDAIAPGFILHDGAVFTGRVDAARLDAALSVARFKQKQRQAGSG